ncbi:MAG: DUF1153 domain-containing protein, partial [Candidatus Adlerbacteria bacterium]|nr:DUF1153 domain-containing protein [Candidatus Adlerbacteria bacterium]
MLHSSLPLARPLATIYDPRYGERKYKRYGRVITVYDLPEVITCWSPSCKALIVKAVEGNLLTKEEALTLYHISEEEFENWRLCLGEGIQQLSLKSIDARRSDDDKQEIASESTDCEQQIFV